eukprot:CAMPEP_0197824884 /NCGR_PEP_ID=MMETSP1437-20131217/2085_1 /TAXON_ID=49252 ORGANISM="Eucampia antarctica, Strain CCMP1452" /NCGR_SAMPLE_ID=MMETSP1437 /ASSEMBLY_ACC=CAM_ASM_001096 /LENGTH=296 /DNA_ID=CAMNT_0043424689 /DNA_START=134 /DNA_END=1024 /DNA_ORIENTATION=+
MHGICGLTLSVMAAMCFMVTNAADVRGISEVEKGRYIKSKKDIKSNKVKKIQESKKKGEASLSIVRKIKMINTLNVVVQNLEKRSGLASNIIEKMNPDLFLAQEISLHAEPIKFQAASVSKRSGYGTAIYAAKKKGRQCQLTDIRTVLSPHAENIPFMVKKTTLANCIVLDKEDGNINSSLQLVSIHAYNGWPTKNVDYLIEHINAVLDSIQPGPVLFAGDFNTWTEKHLNSVQTTMEKAGFRLAYSWPYPGREIPLDHIFTRGDISISDCSVFQNESDHGGVSFLLNLPKNGKIS